MSSRSKGRNLITSYGLFWELAETGWQSSDRRERRHRLLGRLGTKRSRLRVADFWAQTGIYVLYGNYGLYYIGVGRIGERVHDHLTDQHARQWDRFSWFGFRQVTADHDPDGFLFLGKTEKTAPIRLSKARGDIEAILFRAFAGPGNRKHPAFGAKLEQWEQIRLRDSKKVRDQVATVSE
jgi:hypothetical protein